MFRPLSQDEYLSPGFKRDLNLVGNGLGPSSICRQPPKHFLYAYVWRGVEHLWPQAWHYL